VELATGSKPHVCRIMDFGHYKYELAKKAKQAKKKQHMIAVKEIKLRPRTGEHDYDFKLKHSREFLEEGDKVKFICQFRGREGLHREIGFHLLERIVQDLQDIAQVDVKAAAEGRHLVMTLTPGAKAKRQKPSKPSGASAHSPEPEVSSKAQEDSGESAPAQDQPVDPAIRRADHAEDEK
jgi:translation initiation factor IF-3